jgi:hypothetical protein
MRFVSQHSLSGGATASAFLSAKFFEQGALGIGAAFPSLFNFVEQELAGEEAIQPLLARALAFDLQSGRPMQQHHASGRLVDVLAAVAARADKRLFNIRFAHAERRHSLRKLVFHAVILPRMNTDEH